MQRRTFIAGATLTLALALGAAPTLASQVSLDDVLHDPDAPEGGNPKGNLTIVAFTDYNCPFCKKAEPDLARAARGLNRHGFDQAGISVQFGIGDPALTDRMVGRDQGIELRFDGVAVQDKIADIEIQPPLVLADLPARYPRRDDGG